MKSRIFTGEVRHRRYLPREHEFSYRLFMMYLDLDELPKLFRKYWFWSYNKANLASFDRNQFSGNKSEDLSTTIRNLVKEKTGHSPNGPIRLLTHLKYFGYGFNPVSFYFCFEEDGKTLNCIVAEITNTPWKEQHCYVLPVGLNKEGPFSFEFGKDFHVSPFNSMNQQYDWHFTQPQEHLSIHMNVYEEEKLHFDATLNLQEQHINSSSLSKALMKFPFMTSKVIFSIYYQALKLWLKRNPTYTHPTIQETPKPVKKL